jgi:hypothetical protein
MYSNPANIANRMLVSRFIKPNCTVKEDGKKNYYCDYSKNHISPELMFQMSLKVIS